jgi:hypothetical protein
MMAVADTQHTPIKPTAEQEAPSAHATKKWRHLLIEKKSHSKLTAA